MIDCRSSSNFKRKLLYSVRLMNKKAEEKSDYKGELKILIEDKIKKISRS